MGRVTEKAGRVTIGHCLYSNCEIIDLYEAEYFHARGLIVKPLVAISTIGEALMLST